MASFAQLIGRLKAQQKLQSDLGRSALGIDVETEGQQLREARSKYRDDVEAAQRAMAKKERKRSRRGLLGSLLGTGLSFVPGLGAVGGALIGGLASSLGRSSVKPYAGTISTSLPGGKFHNPARKEFSADIASTNRFLADAVEGQSLLNQTNALTDAYNIYGFQNAFGDDIRGFFGGDETESAKPRTLGQTYEYQVGGKDGFTLTDYINDPFDRAKGGLYGGTNKGFMRSYNTQRKGL